MVSAQELNDPRRVGETGTMGTAYHLGPPGEFLALLDKQLLGQLVVADHHCSLATHTKGIDGAVFFLQLEEVHVWMAISGEEWQAAHQGQGWEALGVFGTRALYLGPKKNRPGRAARQPRVPTWWPGAGRQDGQLWTGRAAASRVQGGLFKGCRDLHLDFVLSLAL